MGETRSRAGLARLSALVATTLVGGLTVSTAAAARPTGDVRGEDERRAAAATSVMVVGDSVSQASVGDYSWRYFASRHLTAVGAGVDFVGARTTPHVPAGQTWAARYSDDDFDRDHTAMWGDSFYYPNQDHWSPMVAARPEVVVLALGTNDFGVWKRKAADVVASARTWVTVARSVVHSAEFVLVEIPWVTHKRVKTYNASLQKVAAELSTAESRVVVARTSKGYVMGKDDDRPGDTYDDVHPNTRGQVKIAAAVTDALASLGIGVAYPRPLTFPAEGPRTAPVLRAANGTARVRLGWRVPPGATSHDVWRRAPGRRWVRVARARAGTSYGARRLASCRRYEFRVRARKGWTLAAPDMASNVVSARVGPRVGARTTPTVRPGSRHVRLSWNRVAGACSYGVRISVVHRGEETVLKRGGVRPRLVVRDLPPGATVTVRVRAVGAVNSGRWSAPRAARVRR
ncbi:SGNH/GDSL hydrolase family protein [Nocardioides jishulii]|uniref:Fibronectin type-III domain-containing protein n=1 Tax=Nocardioides jishulii TaxID=2575440 RepID=A0A4U2YL03_9ACTN|nr:SGNH/GDSL hydrolase family protein [Nocardioides jishulii]QCX27331.1 hypothetical protein FCL41_07175 [Nocardioides jishulii]TKI61818.1 hypothetical protein FC770_13815 [Nocardioides jishulii]